jgi:hypothetical protein
MRPKQPPKITPRTVPWSPIKWVSIIDILTHFYGEDASDWPDGEEKIIHAWIKEHNAYYYARPRQNFSLIEAINLAKTTGHLLVVIEDLP